MSAGDDWNVMERVYLLCLRELKNKGKTKQKKKKQSLYKKLRLTVKLHSAAVGKWEDQNWEGKNGK